MAIGTSDGEYYEDRWDYLTRSYQQAGNEEDQGREQVPLYKGGKNVTPKDKPPLDPKGTPEGGPKGIHTENFPNPFLDINKYTPTAPTSKPEPSPALKFWEHPSPKKVIPIREGEIDNEHHVPLIASAIMGDKGEMTGLAIDHRIKVPDEYLPHLALHEGTELPLMHDYMADGMSEQDAYHKAHDIATAVESASVRGHAARNGLDPDAYHEGYKQFFRDAAGIAGEPTGVDRHPRAHTTVHGLDEAELGQKFAENNVIHPEFGKTMSDAHPPLQIDVLNAGVGIHSGPGSPPHLTTTGSKAAREMAKDIGEIESRVSGLKIKRTTKAFANDNQIETAADKMFDLHHDNPDLYNYYKAMYKQKGGEDWEKFSKIDKLLNFIKGNPAPKSKPDLKVIKGGKRAEDMTVKEAIELMKKHPGKSFEEVTGEDEE